MVSPFNWDGIPTSVGVSADPVAGAQLAPIVVPAGRRWLLTGARVQVVMDANVANRTMQMFDQPDGVNYSYTIQSVTNMTAGFTYVCIWIPGVGSISTAGDLYKIMGIGERGLELPPGAILTFNLINIQVGDNIGVLCYTYKDAPA